MVETRSKATEEHVKKLDHQLQVYMAETTKKFDSIDSKIDDLGKKMDLLMSKLFATQDDEVAFSWARFIMVEACICSIDCQCYSCHDDCSRRNEVKNCTLSIDCNCDSCFDGCSRKINEGENQVEVVDSTLEFVELEDQLSEGVLTEKDNELNKLFTMKDWKSNGTLKLFDELLELELVHISCLFAGSSFYIHDEKNDGANIVFDPGGRVFDWLNQLNKCVEIEVSRQIPVGVDLESFFYKRCNVGQLVKCKQKFYMSLNFYVSEIPLYVYSQGYVSTYITIDATSVKGWTMKQFIKVLDDYLRNIKHDSELLYTSLACVLLGWDIILGVEWTYCPSKVVHRSQVMTSVEVVKYKGSLVAFGVIFEDTKSLLQGLRENIIVSISSSSFRVMKVSSFGNGYGVFEVVHVDKGVTAIGNPGALRSKNISTLHWKQLIMFKLHEHLHSVQTVYILSCTMPPVSWWKIMLPFTTLKTLAMKYWLMIPLYLKFQIYVDNIHNREGKRPNHKMHWRTFFDLVALEFDDFVIIVTLLVTWVLEVTTCMEEFKFQVLKFPFNDRPIEGISNHVLVEPRLLLQAAKDSGSGNNNHNKLMEHRRANGLCFRCGDKYSFNHQCKGKQLQFMTGEEIDDEVLQLPEANTEETSGEMEDGAISLNALSGTSVPNTIRLKGEAKRVPLTILVDSGSTHSFLDYNTAKQIGCASVDDIPMKVTVANGNHLMSFHSCPNFKWKVQGVEFETKVRLIQLGGCEMVLGVDWMRLYNPIKFDFINCKIQVRVKGKKVQLTGITEEGRLNSISVGSMKQLIKKGQIVWAHLFTISTAATTTTETEIISEPLQLLLLKYPDVFEEPKTLPPKRKHDHYIPLKPA